MEWSDAMRELVRNAFRLDYSRLAITPALRAAIGILVLLALSLIHI